MPDSSEIKAELRIPSRPVIAALAVIGFLLGVVPGPLDIGPRTQLAVGIYALAALAWLAGNWRPWLGSWLTVAILCLIVHLLNGQAALPGAMTCLVLPTVLAAALISPLAAAAVATGQSALLLWPGLFGSPSSAGFGLVAIWTMLGLLLVVYRPAYQIANWSYSQVRESQRLLEEVRGRRAELRRALEDLASANTQLTRLNWLTQGLRQAAEEARRAKEEFVANVSHELRTPLNMVIGFSELILQAPRTYGTSIPPKLLADLEIVARNSQHLSRLIDDVLDLSQIEAGRMALTKERVALAQLLEAAAVAVRPLFESRGLWLEIAPIPDLPPLYCDRTRIREVLLNLLSNAGRFTQEGGARVSAWREGNDVVVSVADTGPGIAEEDTGRVFVPFQQLDGSIHRRYGGSGLGLSISKSFVELHDGRMWFESTKGRGTAFFFRLPIDRPTPITAGVERWFGPHTQYMERTQRSHAPASAARPRFVVLETGASLRYLLARYLDDADVVPVANLEGAHEELARTPTQALVINAASVGDGLQLLLGWHGLPHGTPAFVCSVPGPSEAASALGVAQYLVKPVSRESLLAALERVCPEAKTVLVVDDELDALQLFRRILRSTAHGYRVLSASDGHQALAILERERPDALVMDLVMPEMDGFRLLATKNADPELQSIPTIVVSARDPAGQPILTSAMAATRGGGVSTAQLLDCITAITRILSPMPQTAGQALPTAPAE